VVAPVIRDLELQGTPDQPGPTRQHRRKSERSGRYPLEPGMHVSDLIRAGGSLEDSAYGGEAELTRYEIVNGSARQTDLIPINLAAVRRGDASADVQLKPYDMLLIKVTPSGKSRAISFLPAKFVSPASTPIHRGETLSSVLRRARRIHRSRLH